MLEDALKNIKKNAEQMKTRYDMKLDIQVLL